MQPTIPRQTVGIPNQVRTDSEDNQRTRVRNHGKAKTHSNQVKIPSQVRTESEDKQRRRVRIRDKVKIHSQAKMEGQVNHLKKVRTRDPAKTHSNLARILSQVRTESQVNRLNKVRTRDPLKIHSSEQVARTRNSDRMAPVTRMDWVGRIGHETSWTPSMAISVVFPLR
jgi:hypothetical protein